MAIIRTGPIAAAISGTLGSVVFVTGGKSTVVRPRPITLEKSSAALAISRNRMNSARAAWKDLTTDEKTAWKTAAESTPTTNALGQTSPIGAFQLFVKTSIPRLYGFDGIPNVPESGGLSNPIQNVTVNFSASGDYDIIADALQAPIAARYLYYGWPFWTNKPTRSVPRLVFLKNALAISPTGNIRPEWIARFGTLQVGQQFAIGITGRLSSTDYPAKIIIRGEVAA